MIIWESHTTTPLPRRDLRAISALIADMKTVEKSLEIGLGFGVSAIHIASLHNGEHIVIDPLVEEYTNVGIKNIEESAEHSKIGIYKGLSGEALQTMDEKVDYVLIDGSHEYYDVLIDLYHADRLLNVGGVMSIHDVHLPAVNRAMKEFLGVSGVRYKLKSDTYFMKSFVKLD